MRVRQSQSESERESVCVRETEKEREQRKRRARARAGVSTRGVPPREIEIFIDNLLVRVHFIIEMILVDRPCATGV